MYPICNPFAGIVATGDQETIIATNVDVNAPVTASVEPGPARPRTVYPPK